MIKDKGVTLIELIIVVAILGVLTAVAVPNYLNYLYKSRISTDIATARELARSAETYCGVHALTSVPDDFAWSDVGERIPVTASNGDHFKYSMTGFSVFVDFTATKEKAGKYVVSSYDDLPVPKEGGY